MNADELAARKHRLSPKLLPLQGISGVGVRDGHVVIYLVTDATDVRDRALSLVEAEAPGTPIAFVVTGAFQKR